MIASASRSTTGAARSTTWLPTSRSTSSTSPESRSATSRSQQQSISFDVDQVGVPVLVKVSYFPNWKVEGAEGPYRVAPNQMIVVPTENDVELQLLDDAARLVLLRYASGSAVFRGIGDLVASTVRRVPTSSTGDIVVADGLGEAGTSTRRPRRRRSMPTRR